MPIHLNEPCGSLGQKDSKYAEKQPMEDVKDNLLCASRGIMVEEGMGGRTAE